MVVVLAVAADATVGAVMVTPDASVLVFPRGGNFVFVYDMLTENVKGSSVKNRIFQKLDM